jgi:hypothetical protein
MLKKVSFTTSSMGLLAKELSPMAVPAAAAARDRHLPFRAHRLHAGWRDEDRQRDALADHGGGLIARGGRAGDPRQEARRRP